MNVYLMHKFEVVNDNLTYSFDVPAGATYAKAKVVAEQLIKQLDTMAEVSESAQKEAAQEDAESAEQEAAQEVK